MPGTTVKTEVGLLDGTPVKRMFWSIISDYNLVTGLCELIDNALDLWRQGSQKRRLEINVTLNVAQQLIRVVDNAGGVRHDELDLLITPGGSKNKPTAEIIGIFGVGSKRAGIALGEHVTIRTRHSNEQSYEIEITKDWLESEEWKLPHYEVPDIPAHTTQVEISHLRKPLRDTDVGRISQHIAETYSWFLQEGCSINVNGKAVGPITFDAWAFPAGFAPQSALFKAQLPPGGHINVEITGGLIRDRNAVLENYGVYVYCNNRLIVKELRTHEVGYFVTSEAGVPHPDASLCRVIARLSGPANLMPWNSSKSGIDYGREAFECVRPTLIQLTSHFSKLSRRLKHDWDKSVFPFARGEIEEVEVADTSASHPLVLPALPKVNKPHVEKLKTKNKKQIQDMPWTLGLVEAMDAVDVLTRQRYETRNRIAIILLDSNFEIALKEFIVHRDDLFPPSQYGKNVIDNLFKVRADVVKEITRKVTIPKDLLDKAQHFYGIRNKLIHERATVEPTNTDVKSYRVTIQKILKILFDLKF